MALMETPEAQLGMQAPEFSLPGTDGKIYSLRDVQKEKGLIVAFICNHCPYVRAVVDQMVEDAKELQAEGIGFVAISANDTASHPEDSFDNMKKFATIHNFTFPYLYDETQQAAKAYGAVCTPDFFGFDANGQLQYRGRLNDTKVGGPKGQSQELVNAMRFIVATGKAPANQNPSMGCNIKWKTKAA